MPPHKRNRMIDTMTPPTSARRSTRVSRTSTGGTSTSTTSSRRKGNSRHHQHKFTASTSDKPARKWAQVLRPPKPGVGFKTLKWVPVNQLTMIERNVYDEEELEKKRKKEMEVVVATSKKNNSEKPGEGGGDGREGEGEKAVEDVVLSPSQKEAGPSTESEPNTLMATIKDKDCDSKEILQKETVEEKSVAEVPIQLSESDEMESTMKKPRIDEGPSQKEATAKEAVLESDKLGATIKNADCGTGEILHKETIEETSIVETQSQPKESGEVQRTVQKPGIEEGPESQQLTSAGAEPTPLDKTVKNCSSEETLQKETEEKATSETLSQPDESDEMERIAKKPRIDAGPESQQPKTEPEIN